LPTMVGCVCACCARALHTPMAASLKRSRSDDSGTDSDSAEFVVLARSWVQCTATGALATNTKQGGMVNNDQYSADELGAETLEFVVDASTTCCCSDGHEREREGEETGLELHVELRCRTHEHVFLRTMRPLFVDAVDEAAALRFTMPLCEAAPYACWVCDKQAQTETRRMLEDRKDAIWRVKQARHDERLSRLRQQYKDAFEALTPKQTKRLLAWPAYDVAGMDVLLGIRDE